MSSETLNSLRLSLPQRALETIGGPFKFFERPPVAKSPVIWSTGGLGDALLSMNVAEVFQNYIGEPIIFYTRYPSVIKKFSQIDARDEKDFISTGADWWITLNTLVLFNFQNNFRGFRNPLVENIFLNYRGFLSHRDWNFLVNLQPFMENMTGLEATKLGLNRQTLIFKMLGMAPRELRKNMHVRDRVLDDSFITVHDGYDDANDSVRSRSTKNWDLKKWEELVVLIRSRYPKFKIVQLGGKTSRRISGVDHDMVGQLSIEDSLGVLSKSTLHIDSESGLVHAAHMLGVKSIVLFGPTNLEFFSYRDNINIAAKFCADDGGCWWLKQNWMAKCPLGYIAPLCMDSITSAAVYSKVKVALDGCV